MIASAHACESAAKRAAWLAWQRCCARSRQDSRRSAGDREHRDGTIEVLGHPETLLREPLRSPPLRFVYGQQGTLLVNYESADRGRRRLAEQQARTMAAVAYGRLTPRSPLGPLGRCPRTCTACA